MKSFIKFWKRDIINKLIVLTLLLLIGGGIAIAYLFTNMPGDSLLSDVLSEINPSVPTMRVSDAQSSTGTPHATEFVFSPDMLLTPTVVSSEPTAQFPTSTFTPQVEPPTSEPVTLTSTPMPTSALTLDSTCIPDHTPQSGKVVEVIDGNTVKVLIDNLVYVVRYIGVAAPKDDLYGLMAKHENSQLIYGKEITLITDVSNKDSNGRLLRYVMVEDTFINLELIEKGVGSAMNVPPDSSCAVTFKQAEQIAAYNGFGIWSATSTPVSP